MNSERRRFLQAAAGLTAAFPGAVLGANDKIAVGLIGAGVRGYGVGQHAMKHPNAKIAAVCDVDKGRQDAFATLAGAGCQTYKDYRRVLERKDIDAVIIATPDHWHAPIMVEALEAGKHIYVEKPLSNTVPGAVRMLNAAEKHKKIVQVGTMQRSAAHFQEAAKLLQGGAIGPITQVVVTHPAGGSPDRKPDTSAQPVPEGFDWEIWQGPAPRHPFNMSRARNWRAWYDYGGGSLTDWGIHHVDIVHFALDPDGTKAPLYVSGAGNYEFLDDPERGAVPATWSVTVQYPHFMMTVLSCTPPPAGHLVQGPMFWGSKGELIVNRAGYSTTPVSAYSPYMTNLGFRNVVGAAQPQRPPAPPAGALGAGAPPAGAPPAPPQVQMPPGPPPIGGGPGGPYGMGGGRGPQGPSIEGKEVLIENFSRVQDGWEIAHVHNWLDCIQSGNKPIADIVTSFNSHLACLMAVQSIKEGRALRWNAKTRTAEKA